MGVATIGAVTALLPAIKDVLGRVFKDKDKVLEAEQEIYSLLAQQDAGQVQVNLADSRSGNLWQAGWRPAAGWTCVVLFALSHGGPIVAALLGFPEIGREIASYENTTDGLLYSLLGMATYRTVERGLGKLN